MNANIVFILVFLTIFHTESLEIDSCKAITDYAQRILNKLEHLKHSTNQHALDTTLCSNEAFTTIQLVKQVSESLNKLTYGIQSNIGKIINPVEENNSDVKAMLETIINNQGVLTEEIYNIINLISNSNSLCDGMTNTNNITNSLSSDRKDIKHIILVLQALKPYKKNTRIITEKLNEINKSNILLQHKIGKIDIKLDKPANEIPGVSNEEIIIKLEHIENNNAENINHIRSQLTNLSTLFNEQTIESKIDAALNDIIILSRSQVEILKETRSSNEKIIEVIKTLDEQQKQIHEITKLQANITEFMNGTCNPPPPPTVTTEFRTTTEFDETTTTEPTTTTVYYETTTTTGYPTTTRGPPPNGGTLLNGVIYLVFNENMEWNNSLARCQEKNMDLVTEENLDGFLSLINNEIFSDGDKIWLGASMDGTTQKWLWVDGEPLDSSDQRWAEYEPYLIDDEQRCLCIGENLKFFAEDCHYTVHEVYGCQYVL